MQTRPFLVLVIGVVLGMLPVAAASAAPDPNTLLDITFPVAGDEYRYIDDYDNPRGGGRLHKSTDIMAPAGTPVHAAASGTITWITGTDGPPPGYGYMITVRGDDGLLHDYIHLGEQTGPSSGAYAPGIRDGVRVERGQQIGYVGSSGCSCTPHLHYAVSDPRYPSDDGHYKHFRYNPYPSLRDAELRGDVPGATRSSRARPLVGDWDGDGRVQPGWWDEGRWLLDDGAGGIIAFSYGRPQDAPIVGDWNGDGRDEIGIIRDREWHLRDQLAGGVADRRFIYGRMTRGDQPLVGDWNGDGRDEIGITRDREWHLRNELAGGIADRTFVYGRITAGDIPLTGDWDGDGRDTVGIVRDGEWHLNDRLSGGTVTPFRYGRVTRGDLPVVGDWDQDGRTDIGIVRGVQWLLREERSGGDATTAWTFSGA